MVLAAKLAAIADTFITIGSFAVWSQLPTFRATWRTA
jgi:hypothetical protein